VSPDCGEKVRKGSGMSETKISAGIAAMVKAEFAEDIALDRHQCGVLKVQRRFIHCGKPGWPDRLGVILRGRNAGKFIGIEVKKPGEKQSAAQIEFMATVEMATAFYFLVESVDQAREMIRRVL
jgi:hypothetical protein